MKGSIRSHFQAHLVVFVHLQLGVIDSFMDTEVRRGFLDANLWKFAKKLFRREDWIFLQDNEEKQTSRLLKEDFLEP